MRSVLGRNKHRNKEQTKGKENRGNYSRYPVTMEASSIGVFLHNLSQVSVGICRELEVGVERERERKREGRGAVLWCL